MSCASKNKKPAARRQFIKVAKATFDASVSRWNIDSPVNIAPSARP